MTQAFNLALLANNLNTTGQLDATDGLTGIVPVANGGTGANTLTANSVLLGNGTSAVQLVAPGASGNVLMSNGTTWQSTALSTTPIFNYREFNSSGTYTPTVGTVAFWVFMWGATGGQSNGTYRGGLGGPGYSEKYYSTVASSYSYTIGAAGGTAGAAGGSSTFGGVISITGGAGVVSAAGSAGGVGSGGDFNASGGQGGNGVTSSGGGAGGPGTRAGNGGNGGNGTSGVQGGGGGGTGGNNASGSTGGAAATAKAAGALTLPFGQTAEFFSAGTNGTLTCACNGNYSGGASANIQFNMNGAYLGTCIARQVLTGGTTTQRLGPSLWFFPNQASSQGGGSGGIAGTNNGNSGYMVIVERIR